MRYLLIVLLLSGCSWDSVFTKPETRTVKQIEYVIKVPPAESLTLPNAVKDIDVDAAKESDIARWLIEKEKYKLALEKKLISIAAFFKTEQEKLNDKAKAENLKNIQDLQILTGQ